MLLCWAKPNKLCPIKQQKSSNIPPLPIASESRVSKLFKNIRLFWLACSEFVWTPSSTAGSPGHLSATLQGMHAYIPLFWELQTELQCYSWSRFLHKALVRYMSLHRDDYPALHLITEWVKEPFFHHSYNWLQNNKIFSENCPHYRNAGSGRVSQLWTLKILV